MFADNHAWMHVVVTCSPGFPCVYRICMDGFTDLCGRGVHIYTQPIGIGSIFLGRPLDSLTFMHLVPCVYEAPMASTHITQSIIGTAGLA